MNKYRAGDLILYAYPGRKYYGFIVLSTERYEIFWLHLQKVLSVPVYVVDENVQMSLAPDE